MAKLKQSKVKTLEDLKALNYYKAFLKYCGMYLKNDIFFRFYSIFVTLYSLTLMFLMLISLYVFVNDKDKFATVAHHLMFCIDMLGGVTTYTHYRNTLLGLVEDVNSSYDYYSEITAQFISEIEKKRRKDISLYFKLIIRSTIYALCNIVIAGYFEKYVTGEKVVLPFPLWYPFDVDYTINYLIAYTFQFMAVIIACLTVFGALAFIYIVYNHVTTELQLLKFAIAKTFERAEEMVKNSKQGDITIKEAYTICVRHCGAHHAEILNFFAGANAVLQFVYIFTFGTGLGLLVSAGFAILSDNTVLKIKFLSLTVLQLVFIFIVCWCGEEIASQSEEIKGAIYDIAWYDLPKECHLVFFIMVERAQKPLAFTTAIGMKANLDTYMSIIRASYSYFNMILAYQDH